MLVKTAHNFNYGTEISETEIKKRWHYKAGAWHW